MKHAAVYDQDDDPDEPDEPTLKGPRHAALTITFDDEAHGYFVEYILGLAARHLAVSIDSTTTGPGYECQLLGVADDDGNALVVRPWVEEDDAWSAEAVRIPILDPTLMVDITRVHVL